MSLKKLLAVFGILLVAGVPAGAASNAQFLLRFHMAYDRDAVAYFAALVANGCTTPSAAFKGAVNTYITAEKAARNWGGQDYAYITTTADQCTASVNLAQPNLYKITYSGACTFSVASGFSGDGSTCFGDTGVNVSALTRVQQNNSHVDICVGAASSANIGGVVTNGFIVISTVANKATEITANANITDTGGGNAGCHYGVRTSSTVASTGKNGLVQSNGVANTSVGLASVHLALCRSSASFCSSSAKIFFAEVGQPLVSDSIHYTNIRTMLVALGATGI